MTKLLLIGCGNIGLAGHLPALAALRDEGLVEVIACDADPAKAAAAGARFGVPTATDWVTAAADVDAVAVCLPPGPNADVAVAAVGRGLHVLCEKPPGRSLDQALALARAQADHPDLVTMIGFNRRFNPLYRRAIDRSLAIGPPSAFYARFSRNALGGPPDDSVPDWIVSASSHAIDLAVATMGYPSTVSVSRRAVGPGPDNVWAIELHGAQGGALLYLNYAAGHRVERFEWSGPGYDVSLDVPKSAEWAQAGEAERWDADDRAYHHALGFTGEYRQFLDAIEGRGRRPACDFAYAPAFMGLVDTILATPDGGQRPVSAPGVRPAGVTAPSVSSRVALRPDRARERPVVVLHQPFAVHHRFFPVGGMAALEARCDVRRLGTTDDEASLKEAQVVVTGRGTKGLASDIVDRAPNLELVVVLGASLRNFAAEELLQHGVTVCNTADAVAGIVAEHCLMLTLAGLRRLPQTDKAMHEGAWPRPGGSHPTSRSLRGSIKALPLPAPVRATLLTVDRRLKALRKEAGAAGGRSGGLRPAGGDTEGSSALRGQTVGLVGWGHTARRFVELLAPFGCVILVASESADPDELEGSGVRRVGLGELLASAKVVSLHKGLTERSRNFIGADQLALLRPGSVLVNTARGELIDEKALVARLTRGDIVAALDVFAEEPLPAKHPLRSIPEVILTPHHSSTTAQEERRMGEQALAIVRAWADGEPVAAIARDRLANMT